MLRRILPSLITLLVRLLGWSWRLRVVDRSGLIEGGHLKMPPLIVVFWHNRLLVAAMFWVRRLQPRRGSVLISRSKDGEILAGVVQRLGGEPVRGSSSRGGATAVAELTRRMEEGSDAWITPDGPRGPRYSVQPGAVWLAQATGSRVLPVSVEASSYWRLKSWDAFIIPKPFAHVEVTLQPLHEVPAGLDDEGMQRECMRLQEVLMQGTLLK